MHGVPEDLVENATQNQIDVMWEVLQRDLKYQHDLDTSAVNRGINASIGGDEG